MAADLSSKWRDNRRLIYEVFFADNEIINRNSEEEKNEFWSFVEKYEHIKAKKTQHARSHHGTKRKHSEKQVASEKLTKINLSMKSEEFVKRFQAYNKDHYRDTDAKDCLSEDDIIEFGTIIAYFLDFQQKIKFNKIAKLRKDQENLPIRQYKDQIIYATRSSQVVIIAGDTGCGKSTQVPQYLLSAGFKKIACTQPRRIACISLAKRVGYETLNEYGSEVAYQVRFDASKTTATRILFLTEGARHHH